MLRDAGFQDFEVRTRKDDAINYEIIRTNTGELATNLSEGEKNFIAFLYFQQKVFGSETNEIDTRPKIIVLDAPVSSIDSSSMFIISEQVRNMINICRNNADNRNSTIKGNFIKQIFILTHNAFFHKEITYSYVHDYKFVSFYLVKKLNNKSSVTLCQKRTLIAQPNG